MTRPDDLAPFHKWTKGVPADAGLSLESGLARDPFRLIPRPEAERAAYLAGAAWGLRIAGRTDLADTFAAPPPAAATGVWGDLDLGAPSPIFVGSVLEIATALARTARFNGWGPRFYSVAEHSILCDELARADGVPIRYRRAILFHDAPEIYTGDDTRPKKALIPELQAVEDGVFLAIAERFDIPVGYGFAAYDDLALAVELRDLFPDHDRAGLPDPGAWRAPRLDMDAAALEFARRAEALGIR